MTRGGVANGKSDVKICCKTPTGWGTGTEIFDRGPVKSNLISQELLQDLPRGGSRIQLLPDKDDGRIGVTMSDSFHTADRGVTIQMDWRPGGQQRRQCGTATKSPFQL